jgi:alkanesulfonate monooxygenase SsuD/methylene tetrahydromethanopterin reductase-like flavin-dependent oxidoreductase (luciferase family)
VFTPREEETGRYYEIIGILPCDEDQARKGRRPGRDARPSRPAGFRSLDESVHRASRDRGTPESVADQILEFRDEESAFGTLLYTGHDWTDPALHGAHGERGPAPDRSRRARDDTANGWNGMS